MARQLVDSMTGKWDPADYRDEFRTRLHEVIEQCMRSGKTVTPPPEEEAAEEATNVVDFMKLLKKSLESKRTRGERPAKKRKSKPAAKKTAPRRRSA